MPKIYDLTTLEGSSLSQPGSVWLAVEDRSVSPSRSRKLALANVAGNTGTTPTKLAPVAPVTLSGTENFQVAVDSSSPGNIVTVPSTKEHLIVNTSQNGQDLVVATTGNSTVQLSPGESLWVLWDGSSHDITLESGGSSGSVDAAMSDTSSNPVQNKVIKQYVDGIAGAAIDSAMSDTSPNPVQNQVIKAYVDLKAPDIDNAMSDISANPVQNQVIKAYIDGLTGSAIDDAMSDVSTNPVQNKVIKEYVDTIGGGTGVVDTAVSTTSNNAVRNSAITQYVNRSGRVRSTDYVIKGSGDTATDDAAWTAAIAQFNSQGYGGTIWLDGEVRINSLKEFGNHVPKVRGLSNDAAMLVTSNLGRIRNANGWAAPCSTAGGSVLPATYEGQSLVSSPNLAFSPGDWMMIWSNNNLPNVVPHYSGGNQYPCEMHMVQFNRGGSSYDIQDLVLDDLTVSPQIAKIPMKTQPNSKRSDAIFADFTIRQASSYNANVLFHLHCLNGVLFENVNWELSATAAGPGYAWFRACANIHVRGCDNDGLNGTDGTKGYGYWFVVDAVNGFHMTDCNSRRQRHSFTTTAHVDNGSNSRWGTPHACSVTNSRFWSNYEIANPQPLDTHAEGKNITFENNDFYLPGEPYFGYGIGGRARNVTIKSNRFWGPKGKPSYGIRNYAYNTIITDNDFHDVWVPILHAVLNGQYMNHCVIEQNRMHGTSLSTGYAIGIDGGTDHRIRNNLIEDYNRRAIEIKGGSNIEISGNTIRGIGTGLGLGVIDLSSSVSTVSSVDIFRNSFVDCGSQPCIRINGSGNNNRVINNEFINSSSGSAYVQFSGGTGHHVRGNDFPNMVSSYTINTGTLTGGAIKIRGNLMHDWGPQLMGLTGTNAASIQSASVPYNMVDQS